MRQTNLTLREIVDQLAANKSSYPSCLLANELGEVAKETKDEIAVLALCTLLRSGDTRMQYAAYGYLTASLANEPGVKDAIQEFEKDPKNSEVLRVFCEQNPTDD